MSDDCSEYIDSAQKFHTGTPIRDNRDESPSNDVAYNGPEDDFDSDGGEEEPDEEDDDEEDQKEDELEPDLEPPLLNPFSTSGSPAEVARLIEEEVLCQPIGDICIVVGRMSANKGRTRRQGKDGEAKRVQLDRATNVQRRRVEGRSIGDRLG